VRRYHLTPAADITSKWERALPRHRQDDIDRPPAARSPVRAIGSGVTLRPPVCAENLGSQVLMMETADHGMGHDVSDPLNRAWDRRILG
jgi:hypothetical protein